MPSYDVPEALPSATFELELMLLPERPATSFRMKPPHDVPVTGLMTIN